MIHSSRNTSSTERKEVTDCDSSRNSSSHRKDCDKVLITNNQGIHNTYTNIR